MLNQLGAAGALLAFAALLWRCVTFDAPMVSSRVASLVTGAVQAAQVSGVNVRADGRDVVLTGDVPTAGAREQAAAVAAALPGVRSVDNQLQVAPPVIAQDVVQERIDAILIDRKVEFEPSRAELLPGSVAILQDVLAVLNQAGQLSLTVEGHTDDRGRAEANRALSQARAQAVTAWLTSQGVSADRVSAAGYGADRPIASNASAEGRAQNRRVEIRVR